MLGPNMTLFIYLICFQNKQEIPTFTGLTSLRNSSHIVYIYETIFLTHSTLLSSLGGSPGCVSAWIFSVFPKSWQSPLSLPHALPLSLHPARKVLTALIFHPFDVIMLLNPHLKLSIHILWWDKRPHSVLTQFSASQHKLR